jgi:hypothetical protein
MVEDQEKTKDQLIGELFEAAGVIKYVLQRNQPGSTVVSFQNLSEINDLIRNTAKFLQGIS